MNLVTNCVVIILACLVRHSVTSKSEPNKGKTNSKTSQYSTGSKDTTPVTPAKPYEHDETSTAVATSKKPSNKCVVRAVEVIDGKETLVLYLATAKEVEDAGIEVFDEICEDDPDWNRVISLSSLCSLVEGRTCPTETKHSNFKDRVKKLPKNNKKLKVPPKN